MCADFSCLLLPRRLNNTKTEEMHRISENLLFFQTRTLVVVIVTFFSYRLIIFHVFNGHKLRKNTLKKTYFSTNTISERSEIGKRKERIDWWRATCTIYNDYTKLLKVCGLSQSLTENASHCLPVYAFRINSTKKKKHEIWRNTRNATDWMWSWVTKRPRFSLFLFVALWRIWRF